MPKPIYIVCSEAGSEDRVTGRVSLFNLVEKIQIRKLPENRKNAVLVSSLSLWVTALWLREPEDEGQEFEFETIIRVPSVEPPMTAAKGVFVFDKSFQRINVRVSGPPPFQGPGTMLVTNRMRRTESGGEWLTQEYPIVVEEVPPLPTDGESSSEASPSVN